MDRRRVIFGLMVSFGFHGLLILILRTVTVPALLGTITEPAWVDYGEISLCEAPALAEPEPTIDLTHLLPDLPKEKETASPHLNPVPMQPLPAAASTSNDTQTSGTSESQSGSGVNGTGPSSPAVKQGVPLHGKVKAGKTIIYILDCSSSMAEENALSYAKRCLQASLLNMDETVKFQIIAYNSHAFSHSEAPIDCSDRNRQAALSWLEKLSPQGSSHHQSGFESACWRRPDAIFFLTDADDLGSKELAVLSKIIPEETYLNVIIFGESENRGLLEKLTAPRGGSVRYYSHK